MACCKLCGGRTEVTHHLEILGRLNVAYHRCVRCDYWCTDEPTWLDEAYSDAIAAADTGLVVRNLDIARKLRVVLPLLFPTGPYVDWAGGYGLLVRLMRDAGFPYYWHDLFAENLFARGFEWRSGQKMPVVTAIEVLEHAVDPIAFLTECLHRTEAEAIIFTQVLHTNVEGPDWWYFTPSTGQHVSFFSVRTLEVMARRLGLHLQSAGDLHALTREPQRSGALGRAVRVSRLPEALWSRAWGRPSLTWSDHLRLTGASPS